MYVPKGHKTSDRGIDITSGYGNWLNLGSALADGLGEDGRAYYHDLRHMNGDYTYGYDNHSYSLW